MDIQWFNIKSQHAVTMVSRANAPKGACGRWGKPGEPTHTTLTPAKTCETCLKWVAKQADAPAAARVETTPEDATSGASL